MYAYAKKYQTSEIWLLYPMTPVVEDLKDLAFRSIKNEEPNVNVNVYFVDLEPQAYQDSIRNLYHNALADCPLVS